MSKISVVVPTYNRCSSVRRLLHELCEQRLDASAFEVVVSIDGSRDGTKEMVEGFRASFSLRGVWNENAGRAAACNAGICASGGDLIVVLDDDMVPGSDCLRAHRDAHAPGSQRVVFSIPPVRVTGSDRPLVRYMARRFEGQLERVGEQGRALGVRDFSSANMSAPRDVLLSVGLFDDSFREYGNEDLEIAVRLKDAGVELLYVPDLSTQQCYEKSFSQLARDTVAKGRTAVVFATKHPEVASELQLSQFHAASRRWRSTRNMLLALTAVLPIVLEAVIRVGTLVDRVVSRDLDTFYAFVLDYCYWVGVRADSRDSERR